MTTTVFFPAGAPNQSVSGALQNLNDAVTVATDTLGAVGVNLTGTNAGGTVVFEGTINGTVWDAIKAYPLTVGAAGVTSASAAGDFEFNCAGFKQVRARLSVAGAGSFTAALNGTAAAKHIGVKNSNAADLNATVVPGAAVETDCSGSINGTVTGATVAAGGTGGTAGTQTVTGTTGTGTMFQASVTVSGGAITAVQSIAVGGLYTASPTNLAAEPVTGAGLTGATLNLTMAGVATLVVAANASRRQIGFVPTSVTAADWALNKSGNGVTAAPGAKGSIPVTRYQSTTQRGDIQAYESTAAVYAYNATPFATFTAWTY
jgi:hypothetical protein